MTGRKKTNQTKEVGKLIKEYRLKITDVPKSRQAFIDDRSEKYFDNEEWMSEKTLMNYETGKNVPALKNIKKLSIALEVDALELVSKILELL